MIGLHLHIKSVGGCGVLKCHHASIVAKHIQSFWAKRTQVFCRLSNRTKTLQVAINLCEIGV